MSSTAGHVPYVESDVRCVFATLSCSFSDNLHITSKLTKAQLATIIEGQRKSWPFATFNKSKTRLDDMKRAILDPQNGFSKGQPTAQGSAGQMDPLDKRSSPLSSSPPHDRNQITPETLQAAGGSPPTDGAERQAVIVRSAAPCWNHELSNKFVPGTLSDRYPLGGSPFQPSS